MRILVLILSVVAFPVLADTSVHPTTNNRSNTISGDINGDINGDLGSNGNSRNTRQNQKHYRCITDRYGRTFCR